MILFFHCLMGSKFEFDDTREQLGVDNLDEEERKLLLNQFKSAGGKVLKERELKRQEYDLDRKQHSEETYNNSFVDNDSKSKKKDKNRRAGIASEKKLKSSFAFFMLRLRAMFAKTSRLNGKHIRSHILELIAVDLRQALVEFNLLGNDLFLHYPSVGRKISKTLDKQNSLQMEAIERLHQLFQKKDFDPISSQYDYYLSSDIPIDLLFPSVRVIYAKLYPLYAFQNTIQKAFHSAIDMYMAEKRDANQKDFNEKKKRVNKDLRLIFEQIFPRMFTLICLYDKMNYPPFSRYLEKAIGFKNEHRLGQGFDKEQSLLIAANDEDETNEENEEALSAENDEATKEKQEPENPMLASKEYQYGKKLMDDLDLWQQRKAFDSKNQFEILELNDKAFLAYLFFREFDAEYSVVLTSNQIKLNVINQPNGEKKDYKRLFSSLYDESRKIHTAFENYHVSKEKLIQNQKNPITSNYIENSKNLTSLKSRVDLEARSLRGLIRYYMSSLLVQLGELVKDMQNTHVAVANPNETLRFHLEIEGKKRMNGKTIENAIIEVYCYCLALKERLENGDLFGGILEMTEEEMISSFGKSLLTKDSAS